MEDKDIHELMTKSRESLEAAKVLFRNNFFDFVASRAYYAMFYAAEAILLTKGLSFSTHKAVIAAFGKEFIKSGVLHSELHKYIIDAFDLRQIGNYGAVGAISKEDAEKLIEQTKEFIGRIEEYLEREGYKV